MPTRYTLRMQIPLHHDPAEATAHLLQLARAANVDEFMFFFFAEEHNNGHDTLDEIRAWIEHSRPYRRALAEAGIAVSFNPWHTLLHCDRGRVLKPGQNWQPMVDPKGREARAVVCPLDEGWQAYYDEALEHYAREGFRVIWIDDDIRYHNHDPLEWGGCFCPLHVAEFNRRAGVRASREEIVAGCTASGEPHPWRALWLDMWEDRHLEMISRWRSIVETHGSRLGLMSSLPEQHAAEGRRWDRWWRAFAGDKHPVHRPHFWGYSDTMGSSLIHSIAVLDQGRTVQPEFLESGPEIECWNYGRWNKSFRQTAAQMSLAHILGSTNLNISLYDFMGNRPDDEPERADFLRRWRPTLDWLADEFPMSLRSTGVGIPWSPDMGRRIRTDGSGGWQSLICPSRGWANWLGAAGHAFSASPAPAVNALAGPVVWSLSDEDLRRWLARGVLLDGPAAHILVERGMGDLIGARSSRFVTQSEILTSVEHCLDEEYALRAGACISVNVGSYAASLLQADLLDGARVASDLRDPRNNIVGHGMFLFENSLGGRVAVVPWSAEGVLSMSIQRAAQLTRTLRYLDPENTHGSVEGAAWLVPQFLRDAHRWRGVVWNAGSDEVEEIVVHLPAGMGPARSATQVNARGERHFVPINGSRIRLSRPMHQWEFLVLK